MFTELNQACLCVSETEAFYVYILCKEFVPESPKQSKHMLINY